MKPLREGNDSPPVVTYECCDYDFTTFGIVYNILTRSYVNEDDINASKDCIDFFGPFRRSDIIVDLSLERVTVTSSDECGNNGCSKRGSHYCAYRK
jgi:hypothetical protein